MPAEVCMPSSQDICGTLRDRNRHLTETQMTQALKFGNDKEACLKAVDIGFELSPKPNNAVYKNALRTLQMVIILFSAAGR